MENGKKNGVSQLKRELTKRTFMIVISGVLLAVAAFYSFAWFSAGGKTNVNNMQIAISTVNYDILVERTAEFDTESEGEPVYNYITGSGELKDKLTTAGYSLSATDTGTSTKIAFEMVNEFTDEGKHYLMPGAYGTVTFYVRPAAGADRVRADLTLTLGGYAAVYEESNLVLQEVDSDQVINLLKGHIMFFTERTGADYAHYVYDGLIDTGRLVFDSDGKVLCSKPGKTDCYELVLYWEWPVYYSDITDNISTSDPAVTRRYPEEVGDYIESSPEYFFSSYSESYSQDRLSDFYNDADQIIGDWIDCLVLYVAAC